MSKKLKRKKRLKRKMELSEKSSIDPIVGVEELQIILGGVSTSKHRIPHSERGGRENQV